MVCPRNIRTRLGTIHVVYVMSASFVSCMYLPSVVASVSELPQTDLPRCCGTRLQHRRTLVIYRDSLPRWYT